MFIIWVTLRNVKINLVIVEQDAAAERVLCGCELVELEQRRYTYVWVEMLVPLNLCFARVARIGTALWAHHFVTLGSE
jgi:hypothetical protein